MSVIVAIKENGVVYMGADTQTTIGKRKENILNETSFKIVKLENGMLLGFCGRVAAKQTVLSMEDVFVLNKDGDLDKKHIVNEIIPKLVSNIQLIGDEDSGEMRVSVLIAFKDKLYRISSEFDVVKLNSCGKSGTGLGFVNWYLFNPGELTVRERLIKALVASAKRTESVGGPYVLINTRDLEYEIVDMGGDNH